MNKHALLAAAVIISSLSIEALATKGMPICDKNPMSQICSEAHFSPAPNPELTPAFHQAVDAEQAAFVARTHDAIIGSFSNGPACNWRETTSSYGYILVCRYVTLSGKICHMMVSPEFGKHPAKMTCGAPKNAVLKSADSPSVGAPLIPAGGRKQK